MQLALAPVTTGLSSPVDLAWRSGDGRMYVVELGGTVVIVSPDGSVSPTPVLDVSADLGSGSDEQGLLGVTFSSDGTKLYVDYVDSSWSIEVVEYTMSGDVADTSTKRVLLTIPHADYSNHYGG
ncbi:MAG TPA: glucose dehydrogenase, partial [Acidimicrobiia bacterium]|nr:glucose dehydrogenase [Acidimicrobiia bacterium]